ncbi:hypothetical protein BGX24_001455 [Mortierella sp. AD032]|nr:hypothetical protein BGX24_001455 [Mortierella sp. AD032]
MSTFNSNGNSNNNHLAYAAPVLATHSRNHVTTTDPLREWPSEEEEEEEEAYQDDGNPLIVRGVVSPMKIKDERIDPFLSGSKWSSRPVWIPQDDDEDWEGEDDGEDDGEDEEEEDEEDEEEKEEEEINGDGDIARAANALSVDKGNNGLTKRRKAYGTVKYIKKRSDTSSENDPEAALENNSNNSNGDLTKRRMATATLENNNSNGNGGLTKRRKAYGTVKYIKKRSGTTAVTPEEEQVEDSNGNGMMAA